MTRYSWETVERIAAQILELETEDRQQRLEELCAEEPGLRDEVDSFLAAMEAGEGFLDEASWAPWRGWGQGESTEPDESLDPEGGLEPGAILGEYRIERLLGRGGMGAVYRARHLDPAIDRTVAIKVVRSNAIGVVSRLRFLRECFILSKLEHPKIARLYEASTAGPEEAFLVMELVDGQRIDAYCEHHSLGLRPRLELIAGVCEAVQFAHRNLVLHRDLKPDNIHVDGSGQPRLLDFGIATMLDPDQLPNTVQATDPRGTPLTPLYASPEQIVGAPITTSSDIYSLGVLLHRLLAGVAPFAHLVNQPLQLAHAIVHDDPAPCSRAASSGESRGVGAIPPDIDSIVAKALRKEPEARYSTVGDLAADVERFLAGRPVSARQGNALYVASKLVRRHWQIAATLLLLVVTSIGFAWTMQREAARTLVEKEKAETVADFMVDVFAGSRPEESLGETLTVKTAMDRAARRVRLELSDQPEIQRQLELSIGRIYRGIGLFSEASPLLERAADASLVLHGPESAELAEVLVERGLLGIALGEYPAGEADLEQALGIRRKVFGDPSPQVGTTLFELGRYNAKVADWARAAAFLDEALESLRGSGEGETLEVSLVVREQGILLGRQGNVDAAGPLLERALAIQRRLLPPLHPEIQTTLNALGVSAGFQGDMETAAKYLIESSEIQEEILPPEHPALLTGWHNLGVLFANLGDWPKAEAYLRRAFTVRRSVLAPGSLRLFESYIALGAVLRETGQLTEAFELLESCLEESLALKDAAETSREGVRRTAATQLRLGQLYQFTGQDEEARWAWEQVLATSAELPGDERSADLNVFAATALIHLGRNDEAQGLIDTIARHGGVFPELWQLAREHDLRLPPPNPRSP